MTRNAWLTSCNGNSTHRTPPQLGPTADASGSRSIPPFSERLTINHDYLREAIQLATAHLPANEGGPFGAVVVQGDRVIGRGWNRVTSTFDPTAHAEVIAIRDACSQLQTFALPDCEIYCSCEPCPLCLAAIYWSRIERIYYAATRDDAATAGFDDRYFYEELATSPDQRSIPMRQALHDEGLVPLQEWLKKPDRIPY